MVDDVGGSEGDVVRGVRWGCERVHLREGKKGERGRRGGGDSVSNVLAFWGGRDIYNI